MRSFETMPVPNDFIVHPTVFAVGSDYQIMIPVKCPMLVGVRVGDEIFYDEYNGVIRSAEPIHRVTVPMELLDRVESYTVLTRAVLERAAYRTKTGDEILYTYEFCPVASKDEITLYHISDAHGRVEDAIAAAKKASTAPDALILNGDIMNSAETLEQIIDVYRIASALTGGHIPCVFSRGNHDFRGSYAEKLADYVPADHGNTYFTFRLGSIWGMVLDCGEDKYDEHLEYGHTVCCGAFRRRETQFLDRVCQDKEFDLPEIKHKILICHVPFSYRPDKGNYGYTDNPFLVDDELYSDWCRKIKEHISPDLMLCGHKHTCEVTLVGGKRDHRGQPCNAVWGGKPKTLDDSENGFTGTSIVLGVDHATVIFNDHKGQAKEETMPYLF